MSKQLTLQLDQLAKQLADSLMNAVICAEEIRSIIRAELDRDEYGHGAENQLLPPFPKSKRRPLLDESTLSVFWKGRSVHLGQTLCFRLLDRLARRPNQYVTHLDLLREVWDDDEAALSTIRSVVRHLRVKLRDGGMSELAAAIRGHNGRYILEI